MRERLERIDVCGKIPGGVAGVVRDQLELHLTLLGGEGEKIVVESLRDHGDIHAGIAR